MEIVKVVGGRVVHPLTNEVGGFKKVPTAEQLSKLIIQGEEILPIALEVADFFRKIKTPDFSRATEYVCLSNKKEYAVYDGDVMSNKGLYVEVQHFEEKFHEFQRAHQNHHAPKQSDLFPKKLV